MNLNRLSKYRAVTGTLPRRYEVAQWSEEKYLQFLDLMDFFVKDGALRFPSESILLAEQRYMIGTYPFLQELFHRIDAFSTDPDAPTTKFRNKFMALIRQVGQYIRLNPSVVTEAMRVRIEANPRFAWCLSHFAKIDTKMSVPVIIPDGKPMPGTLLPMDNPKDPQLRILEAQTHLADALVHITKGLTRTELKGMATKDKLQIAVKIMDVLQKNKGWKPNIGTLNQININAANRDDLEKAMLDFGQKDE